MNSSTLNPIKGMVAGITLVVALACAQGASASDRLHVSAGFNGAHVGLTSVNHRNRSSRAFRSHRNSQRRFSNRSNRNFLFQRNTRNFGLHRNNLNSFYYSTPRTNFSRGCQRVSKAGYWNGYRATIGGRQCIDSRGYSYIVPDSRYLIRYW